MVGLMGPSFPDLRLIVQQDIDTASWLFTTFSIGKLLHMGTRENDLGDSLRGMDALSWEITFVINFCFPFEKGVYSKRKEFAPVEKTFFSFAGKQTGNHKSCLPLYKKLP